jgi:class 3 adenylate cyclase
MASRIEARLRAKRREDALRKKAAEIEATFQRSVAPEIVAQLMQNPERVELGGQMQEVTILFAELRGFSAMASTFDDPQDAVAILNQWLASAAQAVLRHEGTLGKFLGDRMRALFNAPLHQPNHVERAARAAVDIRAATPNLPAQAAEMAVGFSIGICTGEALVGNFGASTLTNYTAIGQAVNQAGRLREAATAGQILLCADSIAHLGDRVIARRVPLQQKQEEDATEAFELLRLTEPGHR